MSALLRFLNTERGHVGSVVASLFALAGMAVLPLGIAVDVDWLSIAGAVLLGLGIIVAVNAPHIWLRRVYGRLDRIQPDDPEARPDTRIRIEF